VPETQGGREEDELRHPEVRVLERALGAPPMAECESHRSRAGATARPHLAVDKLILRRPDERRLRWSPARRVTASGGAPTWSPDGKRTVFGAVITHTYDHQAYPTTTRAARLRE
jgi:hypothetical protein